MSVYLPDFSSNKFRYSIAKCHIHINQFFVKIKSWCLTGDFVYHTKTFQPFAMLFSLLHIE